MTRSKRSPAITRQSSPSTKHKSLLMKRLFGRIAELYARRETLGLAADQLRLLDRYHLRLVRSGALLPP